MPDEIAEILFSEDQIRTRVHDLGSQISEDYKDRQLVFVSVLRGSVFFATDLARKVNRHLSMDFLSISSYGEGSEGVVRITKDLEENIAGKDVLLIEDIVDTGLTLHYLQDVLRAREPKSLRTACLLSKPSRRKVDVVVEYIGFEIEDKFVVGYGLDNAGQFRHLPFIGVQE